MRKLLLAVACILILAPQTGAQVEKGDREIQFQGSVISVESMTLIMLQATYGYYVSPNIEIGVGPSITRFGDETSFRALFFGRYNFDVDTKKIPYLSAQWYQYDFSPEGDQGLFDAAFLQFGGGMKFFMNEFFAYDVSANYGFGLGGGSGAFLLLGGVSAVF